MKNILLIKVFILLGLFLGVVDTAQASSHREAPLIANDPLADNVDLYAFRSPDNPNTVTIIATYVPLQLPHGGPNYYTFGENVRYEIHVDNDPAISGDEITYRFTFRQENEDPTTFFNIRLGAQNLKTTYTLERSTDGGNTFQVIVMNGVVPPNNIGPRSIQSPVGLNTTYDALYNSAVTTASTGESVFAGSTDDPFFVDLGGIFDLGDAPRQGGTPVDGLACYNVSAIAIQVPISTLLKANAPVEPRNILDSDYVIGVWASASRPAMKTISTSADPSYAGEWIQVSRLGMPLTNEAVIPIGSKDFWNAITPYQEIDELTMDEYFYNPELALYMDDDLFGGAVPAFGPLRIQTASLGAFDFSNGADGLYGLKGDAALDGTALDDAVFGNLLLPAPGKPRSVDLWPAFHTGVPNVIPYQLATGKGGNPLAAGKPFVNNFLPNGGDMLRLNMAVPPTDRSDTNFSSLGLIQAAAIGLTVAPFNTNSDLEFIPNMDGFPNGRRLEDDVTRIELQAVAGVVLAAVGLWYDDYDPMTSPSPVTQDLLDVLTYTTGVESNDRPFGSSFPYLAMPSDGTGPCSGEVIDNGGDPGVVLDGQIYISSNNSGQIGVIDVNDDNSLVLNTHRSAAADADGIYYDLGNDYLYQLNRSNGAVYVYDNFGNEMDKSIVGLSAAESSNGREITVSGDRLVIAQDANDVNGQVNRFVVLNRNPDGTTFSLKSRYNVDINLWGIQAEGETLYAIEDNTNRLAVFKNFFAPQSGRITPTFSVTVEGLVRTHGLHYVGSEDVMILTDVGAASSNSDGAIVIIENFQLAIADRNIDLSEQIVISGPASLLGNPVDVALNLENGLIYVAERANGGGRILSYPRASMNGDQSPSSNLEFPGASAIHIPNEEDGQLGPDLTAVSQLFASSNTQARIAVYNILEDNCISTTNFNNFATDADGIYYNDPTGMLYQVNRMNNTVFRLDDVPNAIKQNVEPRYGTAVAGRFRNGRELAQSDNRLVVADDANDANGQTNSFILYNIEGSNINYDKTLTTNINLWGIHANGEELFAIVDNSNNLAEFDNFFNQPAGMVTPSRTISVEGLVRTHGLTYNADTDLMILTDIGEASSDSDGAFIVVNEYTVAASDGVISSNEQIRVGGNGTELGNPVDIAYDPNTDMIFVAERANEGGKILGFLRPSSSGEFSPIYSSPWAGASAVYLSDEVSNQVAFPRDEVFRINPNQSVTLEQLVANEIDAENELAKNLGAVNYKLSPNPTANFLNIETLEIPNNVIEAEIFTNSGIRVQEFSLNSNRKKVDISQLTEGLYYLRLKNGYDIQMLKFIKI